MTGGSTKVRGGSMASSTDIVELLAFQDGFRSGFLGAIRHGFGDDYDPPPRVIEALDTKATHSFTTTYEPTERD